MRRCSTLVLLIQKEMEGESKKRKVADSNAKVVKKLK